MNNEALAVVGGVSAEDGFEGFLVQKNSINSQSFIEFLQILQQKNPETPLAIFMDNASFHHSKLVAAYLKDSVITAIYNHPYSL